MDERSAMMRVGGAGRTTRTPRGSGAAARLADTVASGYPPANASGYSASASPRAMALRRALEEPSAERREVVEVEDPVEVVELVLEHPRELPHGLQLLPGEVAVEERDPERVRAPDGLGRRSGIERQPSSASTSSEASSRTTSGLMNTSGPAAQSGTTPSFSSASSSA